MSRRSGILPLQVADNAAGCRVYAASPRHFVIRLADDRQSLAYRGWGRKSGGNRPGVAEEITARLVPPLPRVRIAHPCRGRPTMTVITRWCGLRIFSSQGTTSSDDSALSMSHSLSIG